MKIAFESVKAVISISEPSDDGSRIPPDRIEEKLVCRAECTLINIFSVSLVLTMQSVL